MSDTYPYPNDGIDQYSPGMDLGMLDQLLPLLAGSTKQNKDALYFQGKEASNLKAILGILTNPGLMTLFGQMDPNMAVDNTQFVFATPTLDRFKASPDPTWQTVAAGLESGELDPFQAKAMLRQAVDSGQMSGAEYKDTDIAVDEIMKDVANREAAAASFDQQQSSRKANDPWSKIGLPNPTEQYDVQFDPQTGDVVSNMALDQGALNSYDRNRADAARLLRAYQAELDSTASADPVSQTIPQAKAPEGPSPSSASGLDFSKLPQAQKAGFDWSTAAPKISPIQQDGIGADAAKQAVGYEALDEQSKATLDALLADGVLKQDELGGVQGMQALEPLQALYNATKADPTVNTGWVKNIQAGGEGVRRPAPEPYRGPTATYKAGSYPTGGRGGQSGVSSAQNDSVSRARHVASAYATAAEQDREKMRMQADIMRNSGRTPTGDAIQSRMALLRALGLY